MIPSKPRLIVTTNQPYISKLETTTWEQRQGYRDRDGARIPERLGLGMTATELTKLMGASHVNHPDYKGREYTLNPEPNLSRRQPMISRGYKTSLWAYLKRACFSWGGYD
jgi:hypothetical protein